MTEKLDYSREEAMVILNNESYSDEDKRRIYEEYMDNLKKKRKSEIVNRLNEYAKNIPVITKEIYISKLKEYENDDLSKPFQIIESELLAFENEMKQKYNNYLAEKGKENETIEPDVTPEEDDFEDTIFSDPIISEVDEEEEEEVVPSLVISDSVLNEEPEILAKPIFNSESEEKEVMPEDLPEDKERGNASAIILSIIAVIIGAVVMYSIIKLN